MKEIEAEYFNFSNKSPYADRQRWMMEMFAAALEKAGTDDPTAVGFALEGMKSRGAKGEVFMRADDHQMHFDMVISHISENVEKPFIYNGENYGMGYITDCLLYTSPSPRDRQKGRQPSEPWKNH